MSCVLFSQNSATHVWKLWPEKVIDLGEWSKYCQVAAMLRM